MFEAAYSKSNTFCLAFLTPKYEIKSFLMGFLEATVDGVIIEFLVMTEELLPWHWILVRVLFSGKGKGKAEYFFYSNRLINFIY